MLHKPIGSKRDLSISFPTRGWGMAHGHRARGCNNACKRLLERRKALQCDGQPCLMLVVSQSSCHAAGHHVRKTRIPMVYIGGLGSRLPDLLAEIAEPMLQAHVVGWREPLYCPEVRGLLAPHIPVTLHFENDPSNMWRRGEHGRMHHVNFGLQCILLPDSRLCTNPL
jgi:hypothetical protein